MSPERRALVDQARQAWAKKLIDLSRNNNLLFYRELKVGTLNLSTDKADALDELVSSAGDNKSGVSLRDLVRDPFELKAAASRLREIAARAQANLEEKGLETLFLGLGMAGWKQEDEGRPASAPVFLLPVSAVPSGRESRAWTLTATGELRLNDVLAHALAVQHGVALDAEALLSAAMPDEEEPIDLDAGFDLLRAAASNVPEFTVTPRLGVALILITQPHERPFGVVQV